MFSGKKNVEAELEISKWLQCLREEKGISQDALGVQLGKGQSDIAKIENGSKRVTVMELISWLKALDVPYNRLDELLLPLYKKINDKKSLWDKK